MGKRRVSEHAIGNQPIAGIAISSGQIVANNPKIVFGYMRELRAASAFPDGPHVRCAGFEPVIDPDVTPAIHVNAGLLKPYFAGIRDAASRDQDFAAIDFLLTGGGAHGKRDLVSRTATHLEQLGLQKNSQAFVAENAPNLPRNIDIFPAHELGTGLDDGYIAAKPAIGLCKF